MNNMKRESDGVEIVDVIRDASSSKLELAEEAPSIAEQLPNDNEQFDDEDVNVNKLPVPVANGTVSFYRKNKFVIYSVLAIALFVGISVAIVKSTNNNNKPITSSVRASYAKAAKNVGVAKAAKAARGSKGVSFIIVLLYSS